MWQHDTCRPGGRHGWQQFTTWSKSQAGSYLTLVLSSMSIPRRKQRGWPEHYPIVHPWSEIMYRPTHRHTSLLSLGIPCPICIGTFQMLVQQGASDMGLNWHRQGYHLGALNFRSNPSFPSGILCFSLIAPPSLQLCQPFDQLAKPHRTSIDWKGPIKSGFQSLIFYR
jgi:hypothetical protein